VSPAGRQGGLRIVAAAILVAAACLAVAKESAAPVAVRRLAEVRVVAQRLKLLGTAISASQGVVSQTEIVLLPAYRPAQLVETVPASRREVLPV
jgi:hypothetical protein